MKKNYSIYLLIFLVFATSLSIGYVLGRVYKTREINRQEMIKSQENVFLNNDLSYGLPGKELVNPKYYAPRIDSAKVLKDKQSGYNLQINTSYFYFTPEKFNQPISQNSGYAYVYVNDKKVGRTYSQWVHLPEALFKTGTNTITITLNSNNYHVWWSKNGTVEAKYITEIAYTK